MTMLNGYVSLLKGTIFTARELPGNGGCGFVPKPSHMMSGDEPQSKKRLGPTVHGKST